MPQNGHGQHPDPGIRAILAELRDLRLEMRAERRQAEAERRQADADRRRADAERRRSDERFEQLMSELREERVLLRDDFARRDAVTQKMFKDIHSVGLSIVKTLNRHTRLLERIDHKLGARRNGGPTNGRRA